MLIAAQGHPALGGGPLEREQLYGLTFVCLNEGSTVQSAQAAMLRRHGISWRRLKIDMVRFLFAASAMFERMQARWNAKMFATSAHVDSAWLSA